MQIVKWSDNIIEIGFENSFAVCDASYRFSHYYEIDPFRGKVVTREELDDYYLKTNGDKDYWKNKWAGANVPDWAFKPFLDGEVPNLNSDEQQILEAVKDLKMPFYVAMYNGDKDILKHELAHAFYYVDVDYREKVTNILAEVELPEVRRKLLDIGYSGAVLEDELHVYAGVFYRNYMMRLGIKVPHEITKSLCDQFNEMVEGLWGKARSDLYAL